VRERDNSRIAMSRLLKITAMWLLWAAVPASAQSIKIVGLGAVNCDQFTHEIAQNPNVQRDYLAWAQGYMSGLLIRAPAGIDESLDLLPPTFPLLKQLEFLRIYCSENPSEAFSGAVETLYKKLRQEGSTSNTKVPIDEFKETLGRLGVCHLEWGGRWSEVFLRHWYR
jgi:hypothetical protein